MPSQEDQRAGSFPAERDATLVRQNLGLFAKPEIRDAIRGATGLSGDSLDRVSEGLAKVGVALILPNGADLHAKYANAIGLVRDHDYSVKAAAKKLGISATHLSRRLNAIGCKGDLQKIADAGDRRILEMAQSMSAIAGETLLEKMEEEGTEMKTADLTKIYTGATNQVATKQRWSQGSQAGGSDHGMTVLAQMLQGKKVTVEDADPTQKAIDVTTPESRKEI